MASYPCAFANVDLTGTPLSMVSGWPRAGARWPRSHRHVHVHTCAISLYYSYLSFDRRRVLPQVNNFQVAGAFPAGSIFFDTTTNKTASLYGGEVQHSRLGMRMHASQRVLAHYTARSHAHNVLFSTRG